MTLVWKCRSLGTVFPALLPDDCEHCKSNSILQKQLFSQPQKSSSWKSCLLNLQILQGRECFFSDRKVLGLTGPPHFAIVHITSISHICSCLTCLCVWQSISFGEHIWKMRVIFRIAFSWWFKSILWSLTDQKWASFMRQNCFAFEQMYLVDEH